MTPASSPSSASPVTQLGIDIGGTGIKGAPVDIHTGELVSDRFRIPTPQPATPDAVAEVVGEIAAHFNYTGPAGITFPGVVKKGVVLTAANVDEAWVSTNAEELFSKKIGGQACVLNDADAAGIAEMRFGAGRDHDGIVILLTIGTGIGSAIFYNGVLLPNTEFGHLKLRGKDAEKRASERVREENNLSWHKWAKHFNELLAEMDKLFSPDLFIVGGGVSKKADKFLEFLKTPNGVPIVAAKTQNTAGIAGAAFLSWQNGQAAGKG